MPCFAHIQLLASSKFWVSWSHRLLLRRMWWLTTNSDGLTELYVWLSDLEKRLRDTNAEVGSVCYLISTAISWWQDWCTLGIYILSWLTWQVLLLGWVGHLSFVSHLSIYMYFYCIRKCWSLSYLHMHIFYLLRYPME